VVGGTGACWGDLPQRAKRGRRLDVNIVASVRLASTGARPGVHSNFGLASRADAIGVARAPLAPDRGRGSPVAPAPFTAITVRHQLRWCSRFLLKSAPLTRD
jgi:hypothetical protein